MTFDTAQAMATCSQRNTRSLQGLQRRSGSILKISGILVTLALAVGFASRAHAHDADCKGRPLPESVRALCCGPAEAHKVDIRDLRQDGDGVWHIVVDGMDFPIVHSQGPAIQPLPSTDGCNWVWYRRNDPKTGTWPPDGSGTGSDLHFYCLRLVFSF
jgi:hypothetical protein